MTDLTTFDQDTRLALVAALETKHAQLAQLHLARDQRGLTAINYDSSMSRWREYMVAHGHELPTRGVLGLSPIDFAPSGLKAVGPKSDPDDLIFRTCDRWGHDTGQPLSGRGAQRAIESLSIVRNGQIENVSAHDLRRTYAKLCKASGMAWEALQANMGHSSVEVTQRYVGQAVDWSERVPNWTVTL